MKHHISIKKGMQFYSARVYLNVGELQNKTEKIICFYDGGPSGQYFAGGHIKKSIDLK